MGPYIELVVTRTTKLFIRITILKRAGNPQSIRKISGGTMPNHRLLFSDGVREAFATSLNPPIYQLVRQRIERIKCLNCFTIVVLLIII